MNSTILNIGLKLTRDSLKRITAGNNLQATTNCIICYPESGPPVEHCKAFDGTSPRTYCGGMGNWGECPGCGGGC